VVVAAAVVLMDRVLVLALVARVAVVADIPQNLSQALLLLIHTRLALVVQGVLLV
jgi:hypothetical protein